MKVPTEHSTSALSTARAEAVSGNHRLYHGWKGQRMDDMEELKPLAEAILRKREKELARVTCNTKQSKKYDPTISLRLNPETIVEIKRRITGKGYSVSQWIRNAIKTRLEEDK